MAKLKWICISATWSSHFCQLDSISFKAKAIHSRHSQIIGSQEQKRLHVCQIKSDVIKFFVLRNLPKIVFGASQILMNIRLDKIVLHHQRTAKTKKY